MHTRATHAASSGSKGDDRATTIYINDFLAKQKQQTAERYNTTMQPGLKEPFSAGQIIADLDRGSQGSPHTTSILRLKRTSNDGSGSENTTRNLQRVRIKSREETSRSKLLPKSRAGLKREIK